ncbi:hypothetical protein H2201_005582 [Coniosporium apollinis]|uniref:Peroxisome membrane anchor protein Pex14p N-terminal domain-containing protein n=1 Tax=Coniosporium apollinis TaxID=61459 RepID=A0ABQ9NUQ9_9PEZI|nr:hypothetical protein H2201_005582 [Coniosporium apollinis]
MSLPPGGPSSSGPSGTGRPSSSSSESIPSLKSIPPLDLNLDLEAGLPTNATDPLPTQPPPAYTSGASAATDADAPPAYAFAPRGSAPAYTSKPSTLFRAGADEAVRIELAAAGLTVADVSYIEMVRLAQIQDPETLEAEVRRLQARLRMPAPAVPDVAIVAGRPGTLLDIANNNGNNRRAVARVQGRPVRPPFSLRHRCGVVLTLLGIAGLILLVISKSAHGSSSGELERMRASQSAALAPSHDMATGYATATSAAVATTTSTATTALYRTTLADGTVIESEGPIEDYGAVINEEYVDRMEKAAGNGWVWTGVGGQWSVLVAATTSATTASTVVTSALQITTTKTSTVTAAAMEVTTTVVMLAKGD